MDAPILTPTQLAFFADFGYLIVPGIVRDEIPWLRSEFDALLRDPDGTPSRRGIVPYVESTARLRSLLEHPRLGRVIADLAGERWTYLSSDGAFRHGDTHWHADGTWPGFCFAKVAIYLDRVTRETGALRVIPGSHRITGEPWRAREAKRSEELWAIPMSEVPAVALTPEPGDLVLFDHNLMHGAFGGSARRMFTLNIGREIRGEEDVVRLRKYLGMHIPSWNARTYTPALLDGASPALRVHLEDVLAQEPHVPELQARLERDRAAQTVVA